MKHTRFLFAFITSLLLASSIQSRASEVIPDPLFTFYRLDFTAFPVGLSTPFSETVGDLQVNYLGLDGTFTLVDASSISSIPTPTPVLLGDPGVHQLDISFSKPMFGIAFDYVTLGMGPISIQFFDGGTLVDTQVNDPGDYPEGSFSRLPVCICPNFFDRVLISDESDPSFAVRQVFVLHNTPDSGSSLSFLAVGLCAIGALRLCGKINLRAKGMPTDLRSRE
jgi:hypothetical protein